MAKIKKYQLPNGDIVPSLTNVREAFPSISIPKEPTDNILNKIGVVVIYEDLPDTDLKILKEEKLKELTIKFLDVRQNAHFVCSLGFDIDANEVANTNIDGLLFVLSDSDKIQFRDYNNEFHFVNKADLMNMKKEIVLNSQDLYGLKWKFENQVNSANSKDDLDKIVFNFGI